MKIAFVGKGGSGKTTLASLFSRYLANSGHPVLVIDADINQHLGLSLGLSADEVDAIPAMGIEIDHLKDYVRGTNPRIASTADMIRTTPPGHGSRLLRIKENNPIFEYFSRITPDGIRFFGLGPFTEEDLGVKCYHTKIGAAELLLSHLVDQQKEYVITDMTAGADAFATGIFTKFDVTFLVVEPTLKSVGVYQQYRDYAKEYDLTIKVIGNKIEGAEDLEFIRDHVGDDLVATIGKSGYIKSLEKGIFKDLSELESEIRDALQDMQSCVDAVELDYETKHRYTVMIHQKTANDRLGKKDLLLTQIDPTFTGANYR